VTGGFSELIVRIRLDNDHPENRSIMLFEIGERGNDLQGHFPDNMIILLNHMYQLLHLILMIVNDDEMSA